MKNDIFCLIKIPFMAIVNYFIKLSNWIACGVKKQGVCVS